MGIIKARIKKSWGQQGMGPEGKCGRVCGPNIVAGHEWTALVWDGEVDPILHETAGLDFYEETRKIKSNPHGAVILEE
jgi:hypothetical protein